MEIIQNPWFILFTGINILALIIVGIRLHFKNRYKPSLFERLRDSGIHPTIRKSVDPSDLKGGDNNSSNNNH